MDLYLENLYQDVRHKPIKTQKHKQSGHSFANNIFKFIIFDENYSIFALILLSFATKGSIYNKSALVQVLAWCRTGAKPLPEPMLI